VNDQAAVPMSVSWIASNKVSRSLLDPGAAVPQTLRRFLRPFPVAAAPDRASARSLHHRTCRCNEVISV
jgi:hypothetical protein